MAVIGIVIAGVLTMAFLANLAVARLRLKGLALPFMLLFMSLALGWLIASAGGFPSHWLERIATVFVLTLSIFFSGIAVYGLAALSYFVTRRLGTAT